MPVTQQGVSGLVAWTWEAAWEGVSAQPLSQWSHWNPLCEWPCLTTRTAASHMASPCTHMCMSVAELLLVVWLLNSSGFRLCSTLLLFKMTGKRPSSSRFFKFMFMHLLLVLMGKYVCSCCNRTKTDFCMTASQIIIWNSLAKRIPYYGHQDANTF